VALKFTHYIAKEHGEATVLALVLFPLSLAKPLLSEPQNKMKMIRKPTSEGGGKGYVCAKR
jgi:hypothetical protein